MSVRERERERERDMCEGVKERERGSKSGFAVEGCLHLLLQSQKHWWQICLSGSRHQRFQIFKRKTLPSVKNLVACRQNGFSPWSSWPSIDQTNDDDDSMLNYYFVFITSSLPNQRNQILSKTIEDNLNIFSCVARFEFLAFSVNRNLH